MTIKLTFLGTILGLLLSSVVGTAVACNCSKDKHVEPKTVVNTSTAPLAPQTENSSK